MSKDDIARLKIQVHEGRGFNVRSFYCTLCLGNLQKFKTSDCIKKSSSPKWDNPQMFEFGISEMKSEVVVQCWETKKTKVFGELVIPLSNFANNETMQVDKWFKLKSTSSSSVVGELRLSLQYTALRRMRKGSNADGKPIASTPSNIDKLKLLANLPRGPPTIYEKIEHNIMEEYTFLQAELERLEEKHGRESGESKPVRALLELLHKKSAEFHLLSMHQIKDLGETGLKLGRLIEQLNSTDENVQHTALSTILNEHLLKDDGTESRELAGGKGIAPLVSLTGSAKLRSMALSSLAIVTAYLVNIDELESHIFSIASGIPELSAPADIEAAGIAISNIYGNNPKTQEKVLIQGDKGVVAQSFAKLLPSPSEKIKSHILWALAQTSVHEDKQTSENQKRIFDFISLIASPVVQCLKNRNPLVQELAASTLCTFHNVTAKKLPQCQDALPLLLNLLKSEKESVLIQALKTIANLATEGNTREKFVDSLDSIPSLVTLLIHPNNEIQLFSAWTISSIVDSDFPEVTSAFVQAGTIPSLLRLLGSSQHELKVKVLWALCNLSTDAKAVEITVASIDMLSNLLASSKTLVRIEVLRLFSVLAVNQHGRDKMVEHNIVHSILQQFTQSDTQQHEVKEQALWALCRLATNDRACDQVRDGNGFYSIIALLNSPYARLYEPLLRLIFLLINNNEKRKQEFCELGGIPLLVNIFSRAEGNVRKLSKCIMTSLSKTEKNRRLVAECIVLNVRITRK